MRPPSPPRLSRAETQGTGLAQDEADAAWPAEEDAAGPTVLMPAGRVAYGTASVSTRLAERLAEKVAARRRLTRLRVAALAAGVAVLVGLAYLLLASPVLALAPGRIEISGTGTTVDPDAVAAIVDRAVGSPLARIDVDDLEAAISGLTPVRSAEITRVWPNGLAVAVVSREPVAAVPSGRQYALLDVDGVQVGLAEAPPEGLPRLDIPMVGRTADALAAALRVLGALPPELHSLVSEAGATSADTVRFRLSDGARVEWGSADSSALKARVLEVLRQRPAAVYDVSAPTMPVTR